MDDPTPANPKRGAILTACACAALLALMFALSWFAVETKSPTMDEPLHAVGAFVHVFHRDYRINPEDPPLWNYWSMLPHARDALRLDLDAPDFVAALAQTDHQFTFCVRSLFQTPANDGVAFVQRSRLMMLLAAVVMLGPLVAWWGWRLGGAVVAVGATLMLALDPNFLAHAPLVKNDVPTALVTLALAAATWAVGRRVTWGNVLLPGLVVGMGMGVKFSGVLLAPMLIAMLTARALLLPAPWTCFARDARGRGARLLVAIVLCALAAATSALLVWAAYGFRFDATPQPGTRLPIATEVANAARVQYALDHDGAVPGDEQIARTPPRLLVRAILFAERHQLLPQPWLYGLLFTYRSTLVRDAFLLGMHSDTGWWYYFPLAMLFKTPLATLGAFALALIVTLRRRKQRNKAHGPAVGFSDASASLDRWSALCLAIPVLIYGLSALTTNLNLGLRHVLPLYPFLYLMTALALAPLVRTSRKLFRPTASVLALALAVETCANFPDYIPFFNAAFRPHRITLLSDSNLDWGQDLPALAEWREGHAGGPFYFCYFGTCDPHVYGIDYIRLPAGFWLGPEMVWLDVPAQHRPGLLAISATRLQGVHVPPSIRYYYAPLLDVEPLTVLGGSIYVYRLPLPPGVVLTLPTRQQLQHDISRERRPSLR